MSTKDRPCLHWGWEDFKTPPTKKLYFVSYLESNPLATPARSFLLMRKELFTESSMPLMEIFDFIHSQP